MAAPKPGQAAAPCGPGAPVGSRAAAALRARARVCSRRSEPARAELRPRILGRTAVSRCGPGAAGGGSGDPEFRKRGTGVGGRRVGRRRGSRAWRLQDKETAGSLGQGSRESCGRAGGWGGGLGGAEGLRSAGTWDGVRRQAGPPGLPACAKGGPAASGAAGAADAEKWRALRVGW